MLTLISPVRPNGGSQHRLPTKDSHVHRSRHCLWLSVLVRRGLRTLPRGAATPGRVEQSTHKDTDVLIQRAQQKRLIMVYAVYSYSFHGEADTLPIPFIRPYGRLAPATGY